MGTPCLFASCRNVLSMFLSFNSTYLKNNMNKCKTEANITNRLTPDWLFDVDSSPAWSLESCSWNVLYSWLEVPHHKSGEYIGSAKFLVGTQGWDSNTSSTPIYFVFLLFLELGQVQPGFSCLWNSANLIEIYFRTEVLFYNAQNHYW